MSKVTIKWLKDTSLSEVDLVGGKNASLGEMISNLSNRGIRVPNGFAVTTVGFTEFIEFNNLRSKLDAVIGNIVDDDIISLRRNGLQMRLLIQNGQFPEQLEADILKYYDALSHEFIGTGGVAHDSTDVAVRSSSTAEDLQNASFAGQQETYLNIRGGRSVLEAIKNCFASLYTDRAISYRKSVKYSGDLKISVCVQKMVRSDIGSSGVAFSIDPDSGFKKVVVINGAWGLGELVVQGGVKPDEIILFKDTIDKGYASIIDKKLGDKKDMMVYGSNPNEKVKVIQTGKDKHDHFCITDDQSVQLAKWVMVIEKYYSELYGKWTPVDIEWAIDGLSKELFIVQARPETVHSQHLGTVLKQYRINPTSDNVKLIQGIAVGDKISAGRVRIIHSLDDRYEGSDHLQFNQGDILVTDMTDPDWEPIMVKASAIITNKGGRTCHASIIARELGINAVVGTGNCTEVLKNDQSVTVSCAEGEIGYIYDGNVPYDVSEIDMATLPEIKTKVMFNIASPNDVFKYHNYPAKGVGLVREEFIINNFIKAHPMALINYRSLTDSSLKHQIDELTKGYNNPTDYYVEKLCFGLSRIAATFYPHDVIVRFSDFKSNE